jgi:hypothetical protein
LEISPARVVNENATHQPRGNRKEMRPVLPTHAPRVNEAQVNLMDQSGCLYRVPRSFTPEVLSRHPSQFFIDQRNQLLERSFVSLCPLKEQLGYIVR